MIVSTEGDLGDATYLLCILMQLEGGPHKLLLQASEATKWKGREGVESGFRTFGPLANSQSYVEVCRIIEDTDKVDWPSGQFRGQHYMRGRTLMEAHLAHLVRTMNVGRHIHGNDPWLFVEPSQSTEGKVLCNRTGRYRNSMFPWKKIVEHYRHRLVFVGLRHEWREFIAHFGYVAYQPTSNLLEMAQLIAGCSLFIGNQSCANALAEGIKKPLIQETSTQFPDCVYVRPGAQHVHDGACILPDISGSGELSIASNNSGLERYSTSKAPPGGFQYPGVAPSMQFTRVVALAQDLEENKNLSKEEVGNKVLRYNIDRCPEWQKPATNGRVLAAMEGLRNQSTSVSRSSLIQGRVLRPTNDEIRARYQKRVGVKS